jgi:hypothetical protein
LGLADLLGSQWATFFHEPKWGAKISFQEYITRCWKTWIGKIQASWHQGLTIHQSGYTSFPHGIICSPCQSQPSKQDTPPWDKQTSSKDIWSGNPIDSNTCMSSLHAFKNSLVLGSHYRFVWKAVAEWDSLWLFLHWTPSHLVADSTTVLTVKFKGVMDWWSD